MKLEPLAPGERVQLRDSDARARGDLPHGDALENAARKQTDRIADLQRVLYADGRRAMLIVLQGRDASGKDGTIRKVFTAVNPQGCEVTSFKAPTELESRHDFLWRVHARVPPLGMIGIFNRSHYEDVIVPRVRGGMKKKEWLARYQRINDFERLLTESGVVVLKFLLHISRGEQKQRLNDRLSDKTKNWKFRAADLDDRALWSEYTKAYRSILEHTSTEAAPWYVVPADDNDARNYLVARTIADALDDLDLRYPRASKDVLDLKIV
ncbi:MAG TPA: PPK2 family polyphosphate kinase [Gemmatimonadaceae bacterium]|nr:PPK2 family polyphosphate kinase [Gemmatimonadaceae bacterium]